MKSFRHLLMLILCLALVISCVFALSSCKKDEKEDDNTVDAGNNDDNGNNNGNEHTHSYTSTVTRLPGVNTTGVRTYSCSCGHTYTEDIEAVTVTLPSVADMLASIIGANTYSVEIGEDAEVILIEELSDWEYGTGDKTFVAIKVANAEVSGEGNKLTATLSVELGIANVTLNGSVSSDEVAFPGTFDAVNALNIYVNGDDVSVEVTSDGITDKVDANISDEFYNALAESMGTTREGLLEGVYLMQTLQNYLPLVEGLAQAIASINIPEANVSALEVLAILCNGLVDVTTEDNGDTVYALDLASIADVVAEFDGMTLAQIIDAQYGAGTTTSIANFIKGLPTMKIKQIAEKAVAFSESCNVPIDSVYALINYLVYNATDKDFVIQNEIASRYEMTLAALVAEMSGTQDAAQFETQLTESVNQMVDMISVFTVDQLYNFVAYGNPNYSVNGETAFSITAQIKDIANLLGENVTAVVRVDANGNVTVINLFVNELTHIYIGESGFHFEINIHGEVSVFNVAIISDSLVELTYTENGNDLFVAAIALDQNGEISSIEAEAFYVDTVYETVIDSTGTGYVSVPKEVLESIFTLTYSYDGSSASLTFVSEDVELDVNVAYTVNVDSGLKEISSASVVLTGYAKSEVYDEENDNWEITGREKFEALNLTYSKADDASVNVSAIIKDVSYDYVEGDALEYVATVVPLADATLNYTGKALDIVINTYAESFKQNCDENGKWVTVYESRDKFEVFNLSFKANDDGSVSLNVSANGITYTYDESENSSTCTAKVFPVLMATVEYNGTDTLTVDVNGMTLTLSYASDENGETISAALNLGGEIYNVTLKNGADVKSLTISDDNNDLLIASASVVEGLVKLDFIVNAYETQGYFDDEDNYVVTSKELFNVLTAGYYNGILTVKYDDKDQVTNVTASVNDGLTVDIYHSINDFVLLDGSVSVNVESGADYNSLTISIDLDNLNVDSREKWDEVTYDYYYINTFLQMVGDIVITHSW